MFKNEKTIESEGRLENLKKLGLIKKSTLKVKIFGEGKLSEKPNNENIKISKGVKVG